MISTTQCRMARAALGWSVKELAERAHISANTVVRFENEKHAANASTLHVLKQAFEAAGVRFTDDGGVVPPS
jgi:transcriptional regulator with XRE-family HTH domain